MAESQIFGNFVKATNAKSAFVFFIPIAQILATYNATFDRSFCFNVDFHKKACYNWTIPKKN
jgi:hypothetical protein